jgi:hypothetical protein
VIAKLPVLGGGSGGSTLPAVPLPTVSEPAPRSSAGANTPAGSGANVKTPSVSLGGVKIPSSTVKLP